MAGVVKDVDMGMDAILKNLESLGGKGVKIGIQSDAGNHPESGEALVDIAIWNEYGTATVPSRPAFRDCAEQNDALIEQGMVGAYRLIADGRSDAEHMLRTIGQWYQDIQKNHIRNVNFLPRLRDATVAAKKGSTKTLIDKGHLINSIRYEVVK